METVKKFIQNAYVRYGVIAILAVIIFAGSFYALQAIVTSWCLTPLPGVATGSCGGGNGPQFNPVASPEPNQTAEPTVEKTPESSAPQADLPDPWDGASRVNILVMGLDYADWEKDRSGPARSDTMVVLTIDPQTKTGGMISIPRDMWVSIPGFDYGRINTAYFLGDSYKLPGGGPVLAAKTVEQFLGVPIHYYGQVDFMTFVYLINQIGGIDVYIDKKIKIDPIGPGADDVVLPVGLKHLDGMRALAYARQRYGNKGDVDRAIRTQKVIMAIRDKFVNPANFPGFVASAPGIYQTVQSGIKTNMSLEDGLRLAALVQQIPPEKIKRGVIDNTMSKFEHVSINGTAADVLKPFPDKIRELRDTIFTSDELVGPAAGKDVDLNDQQKLADLLKKENATVFIHNGTYTQGLGTKTADYFKTLGINVVGADNANEIPGVTKIIDHRGKPYAIRFFKLLFGINSGAQIVFKFDPAAQADIEIILGDDWAAKNPMPK